jgi:hypothetical protein
MTIDEQIAVMQGYKDGKSVQMARKGNTRAEKWVDQDYPVFDFSQYDFRLKPEPEPPKYEPFSFEDDLVGKIVVLQNMYKAMISGQSPSSVHISGYDNPVFYNDLLRGWTFTDGSPCGKLKN